VIQRLLIANRGEIAVRVIRAARELGISPVAIYGDGEQQAVHVRMADDAYLIPPSASLPYLNVPGIVEIAKQAGVDAIHPGYGFLAENSGFAEAVAAAGIVFVGPSPAAILAMGDKVRARGIAIQAGVPVVPGSDGPIATIAEAEAWAAEHGYPIAVKAAAGGGGRGFRVAKSPDQLADAFNGSSGEAQRYFGNPTVYLERYLERPRHIEAQIFADNHGNAVFLGERDCSVQRRHQKLVEEAPSPAMTPETRKALGEASVALVKAVNYSGAGTIEYMLAEDGRFYFLEMNTRIQVEHTVTEEVTGIDLVKEQLRVASGEVLSFSAETLATTGHSIECRINAEDAGRDFAPTPGTVTHFRIPGGPGIRVDTAFEDGASILPTYDSLIAKLIVWGRDRDEAVARTRRALAEFTVDGVATTIPFHQKLFEHEVFVAGGATTSFLAEYPEVLPPPSTVVAAAADESEAQSRELLVEVNGRRLQVRVFGQGPAAEAPAVNGTKKERAKSGKSGGKKRGHDGVELTSPLQGTVIRISAQPGATVTHGQLICVIEAMKMENEIVAHRDGTVTNIAVQPGDSVKIGAVLATIE
jgi:acetyl-CoA/propionyl-CoA carboxylase biotin carboxyl carrier protein